LIHILGEVGLYYEIKVRNRKAETNLKAARDLSFVGLKR
jgi:hypothetical protein